RADGCPAEPAASRRARQTGVAGHGFCGHAWAATAPRGPSVDVSERQMGLRRLGTESSPDSPLEEGSLERTRKLAGKIQGILFVWASECDYWLGIQDQIQWLTTQFPTHR